MPVYTKGLQRKILNSVKRSIDVLLSRTMLSQKTVIKKPPPRVKPFISKALFTLEAAEQPNLIAQLENATLAHPQGIPKS